MPNVIGLCFSKRQKSCKIAKTQMHLFLRFRQRAVLVILNRSLSQIGNVVASRPELKQVTSAKEK